MPRWFAPLLVVCLVGLAGTGAAVWIVTDAQRNVGDARDLREPDPGLEGFVFPEFELIDQDGEPVDESILDGNVTIVDFIFTNCPFACPGLGAAMLRLQSELAGTPVRFLSVSVDPDRDTPERLREYAAESLPGADLARWSFLTGDKETIYSIVRDHLKFNLSVDESQTIRLKGGEEMFNIAHPTKLFLVGPDRRVLMLASYGSPAEVGALGERARRVARP